MLAVRRRVPLDESFAEPGSHKELRFLSVFPIPFNIKEKFISSSTT